MKTVAILFAISILLGCSKTEVKQAPLSPIVSPSLTEVKAAVVSAAIQKGVIVTSVEKAPGDLTYLCKGELKTKAIPVSDTLVLKGSEAGQWQGSVKFDLDQPIKVIVKKQE